MPFIWAAMWNVLLSILGTIVGRVLVSLGVAFVNFTGILALVDVAKDEFSAGVSALPPEALALAGLLKVGVCVSMLLSALSTRLLMNGLTSGVITKAIWQTPGE